MDPDRSSNFTGGSHKIKEIGWGTANLLVIHRKSHFEALVSN